MPARATSPHGHSPYRIPLRGQASMKAIWFGDFFDPQEELLGMKYVKLICAVFSVILFAGCITDEGYSYRALDMSRTNPAQLQEFERYIQPSINIQDVAASRALSVLESTIYPPDPGELYPVVTYVNMDHESPLLSVPITLKGRDIPIPELYDRICVQAGLRWWIDDTIHVSRMEDSSKPEVRAGRARDEGIE